MPTLVRFKPENLTAEHYDDVDAKLQGDHHWPPDGLMLHVAFGPQDHLMVSEIWESREKMEAFHEYLMPMLEAENIGFEGEPEYLDVHHIDVMTQVTV